MQQHEQYETQATGILVKHVHQMMKKRKKKTHNHR